MVLFTLAVLGCSILLEVETFTYHLEVLILLFSIIISSGRGLFAVNAQSLHLIIAGIIISRA